MGCCCDLAKVSSNGPCVKGVVPRVSLLEVLWTIRDGAQWEVVRSWGGIMGLLSPLPLSLCFLAHKLSSFALPQAPIMMCVSHERVKAMGSLGLKLKHPEL
jgi:hypothetical protein